MRVVLINPLVDKQALYGRFRRLGECLPPLGLAYVAAVLEKAGHAVSILDSNVLGLRDNETVARIVAFHPTLIGLTATTLTYYRTRDLAAQLKIACPEVPIVFGGPHALGMESDILKDRCFDCVVSGEGEFTALDLVNSMDTGKAMTGVVGLSYRDAEGVAVTNARREAIADLDSLPFPARHLLPPLALYRPKATAYRRLPATHIFTSRGCPYRCVFCRTAFGRKVRFHSPEYVIAEIEHLKKDYGVRELKINDDTFTVDVVRVHAICDLILSRQLDVTWSCNVRANLVDRPLLQKMRAAGCWEVAVGLESGSDEILRTLKKGATVEQGVNACRLAAELGLIVRPSFIIGNPGETLSTIEQTIRLAASLPVHYPSFSLMTPFPGTELWEHAEEYGSFDRSDFSKLSLSSRASFVPRGLDAETLERKQREAYQRVYLRPTMALRHIRQIRSPRDMVKLMNALSGLLK